MAQPFPMDDPLLQGAFQPLRIEADDADLVVEGRLPEGLAGVLYRIGPNPRFAPRGRYNPLHGEGMVHAFRIDGGRVSYRNRWVRTRRFQLEAQAGRALFATADPRDHDPSVAGVDGQGAANTSIVFHGGRLLALEEGAAPIELTPDELRTIGPWTFGGRLRGPVTAHPRIDPETGEMIAFANFPSRRFDGALALYLIDARGELVRTERVPGPYPALVHDFAITPRHVVFAICPLTLSLERLQSGGPPVAWEPQRGAFLGVVGRDRPGDTVRWFAAPACMAWHLVNAWEEGDRICLDLCAQAAPAFPAADGSAIADAALQQRLARWTVDLLRGGAVDVQPLSDVVCEYPRIDARRTGQAHRCVFVATDGGPGTGDLLHRAVGRVDLASRRMTRWRSPEGCSVSEPVFVPDHDAAAEGDGWLLTVVYDARRNASWLAVLDARDLAAGPVARAHLDHRVPAGFHGTFVPDR